MNKAVKMWVLAAVLILVGANMVGCKNKTAKVQTETSVQPEAGQARVKCHIEGEILSNQFGNDVVICEEGTDLRVHDAPSLHVKAVNGKFSTTIESDYIKMYEIYLAGELEALGSYRFARFLVENGTVKIVFPKDDKEAIIWTSDGEEGHQRQVLDSMLREKGDESSDFEYDYLSEHPMLWTLFKTRDCLETLQYADNRPDFDPAPYQRYITLYHDKLSNLYPDHPIHEQIAMAETAYQLQPGKPYIDYIVRNTDGQLVPISALIRDKVALIDLWASWCGPCRRHSIAMIPIYERYKDKGFTVVAIARESKPKAMEKAARKDGYPWPCLMELQDENKIWLKNGANNSGGAMFLIDRDGTILSKSTDAEELEPLIRKALSIE